MASPRELNVLLFKPRETSLQPKNMVFSALQQVTARQVSCAVFRCITDHHSAIRGQAHGCTQGAGRQNTPRLHIAESLIFLVVERTGEAGTQLLRECVTGIYSRARDERIQTHQYLFCLKVGVYPFGPYSPAAKALISGDFGVLVERHIRWQRVEQAFYILGRLEQGITVAAPNSRMIMLGTQGSGQRMALQKMSRSPHSLQRFERGLDVCQLARVVNGKK